MINIFAPVAASFSATALPPTPEPMMTISGLPPGSPCELKDMFPPRPPHVLLFFWRIIIAAASTIPACGVFLYDCRILLP
jgi:hypothetical protein